MNAVWMFCEPFESLVFIHYPNSLSKLWAMLSMMYYSYCFSEQRFEVESKVKKSNGNHERKSLAIRLWKSVPTLAFASFFKEWLQCIKQKIVILVATFESS